MGVHAWSTKTMSLDVDKSDGGVYQLELRDGKTGGWAHLELQDVEVEAGGFSDSCDVTPSEPVWPSYDNFCVSAKNEDLVQTKIIAGDASIEKCQEQCLGNTSCTAIE